MNTHVKGCGICPEMWRILFVAGAALVCVVPAHAVDGVVEINQARALAGGVTAGDIAGFPVKIGEIGSYRLTSDLNVPADTKGIQIFVSDVTLDLNGFSLVSAGGAGFEDGISWFGGENIEIRNGTVRGFPGNGISAGNTATHYARVIDVRAIGNGFSGIDLQGAGHLVDGCTALNNSGGIRVIGDGSLVINSVVRGNAFLGLTLGSSTGYRSNVLTDNNGGNANPQVSGIGAFQLGSNVCGNALCP